MTDPFTTSMNRRIQDSALRAARLNAQYQEERQHTANLQEELNTYRNGLRNVAVTIIDNDEQEPHDG